MLTRREHSRKELQAKLLTRGYNCAAVMSVLDELEAGDWLSDERFAAAYAQSRVRRGFGPVRIREELRQRGVEAEQIRQACDSVETDWNRLAGQARRKRFGAQVPQELPERARQQRYLSARGFDHDHCRSALQHPGESLDEQ